MAFPEKIISFLQDRIQKLTDEEKRRLVLVCTAVFVVILTLSVVLPLKVSEKEKLPAEVDRVGRQIAIPPEELFLPDEPDFIPGVLLEREQRSGWTEQDASDYWQDPLRYGEEQWREKIEIAIDEFLERVP